MALSLSVARLGVSDGGVLNFSGEGGPASAGEGLSTENQTKDTLDVTEKPFRRKQAFVLTYNSVSCFNEVFKMIFLENIFLYF